MRRRPVTAAISASFTDSLVVLSCCGIDVNAGTNLLVLNLNSSTPEAIAPVICVAMELFSHEDSTRISKISEAWQRYRSWAKATI